MNFKNSNNCDDLIVNEVRNESKPTDSGCSRPHIQHSEEARRTSSRPLRWFGVVVRVVTFLASALLLCSSLLLAFERCDSQRDNNTAVAYAETLKQIEAETKYYLKIPAGTVFDIVGTFDDAFGVLTINSSVFDASFPVSFIYLDDKEDYFTDAIFCSIDSIRGLVVVEDYFKLIDSSVGLNLYPYSGLVNCSSWFSINTTTILSIDSFYPEVVKVESGSSGATEEELENAYNNGYDVGYVEGFADGEQEGYYYGYIEGSEDTFNDMYESIQNAYDDGYTDGEQEGYNIGYNAGYTDGMAFDGDFVGWIIDAVGGFFSFEIFPNFSLGGLLGIIVIIFVSIWLLRLFAGG